MGIIFINMDFRRRQRDDDDAIEVYRESFDRDPMNKVIQNALCSCDLQTVAENRQYMQSLDSNYSHVINPKLSIIDQKRTGKCWMFASLDIFRRDLVMRYKLESDFELSDTYITFYEKYENCGYVLDYVIKNDKIRFSDRIFRTIRDGGSWCGFVKLVKKYGIVPKSCFRESVNCKNTKDLNNLLQTKIREFAYILVNEPDMEKRYNMKYMMMGDIFMILAKMLGTPPGVNEKIVWYFTEKEDEKKDKKKTSQLKRYIKTTPLEFYTDVIGVNLDDYVMLANDPRNEYYKAYCSYDHFDSHFNMPIENIMEYCKKSIINNNSVIFGCDVSKYIHSYEEIFDEKCFDLDALFGMRFDDFSKKDLMLMHETGTNHLMVLVGIDIDDGNEIIKFKVANSWGGDDGDDDGGSYNMDIEWFKKYTFDYVIHKKYFPKKMLKIYNEEMKNKIALSKDDVMF